MVDRIEVYFQERKKAPDDPERRDMKPGPVYGKSET